jgi:4-hydroxybenzoate polyprenyltransferase
VFTAIFFAKDIFIWEKFFSTSIAALVFCLVASSVYIVNDIFDRETDAKHPVKKNRPLASGEIRLSLALWILFCLLVVSFGLIFWFVPQILWLILLYLALNFVYSFYLKKIPIIELLTISSFYLLRIEVGGLSAQASISRWLILCTIFISLFLVIGKRLAEYGHAEKRIVLYSYSEEFLKQFLVIASALSIASYGLYSILGVNSSLAIYAIFFVILGISRYLYLIYNSQEAEEPEKLILNDHMILITLLVWAIYMFLIFYI